MKKYTFCLTVVLGFFVNGATHNLNATQKIEIEFDPNVAIVTEFTDTKKIKIEPINPNRGFDVSTAGKNKIVISEDKGDLLNTDIISEKILNVEEKKKPLARKGDITDLLSISHTEMLFRFHNHGYMHTASKHSYINCCFESEKEGAGVILSGKSSRLDQSTPSNFTESFRKSFLQVLLNNLSDPLSYHQPITDDSFIKEIFVTAYEGRFVPVTCHVNFTKEFELDSAWKNASLTLTPNSNFSVELKSSNN